MDFEIGDWVVYTPYIEGIASAKKRKHDHGIITSVLNDYVILDRRAFQTGSLYIFVLYPFLVYILTNVISADNGKG